MTMTATCSQLPPDSVGPGCLRLSLLGGFSMVADGEQYAVPESCQRLLVYLALRERPQRRIVVAATLWPEKTDVRACANLRSTIWRLPEPLGVPLISGTGTSLQLSEFLIVDVREAEAAGWALVRDPESALDHLDPELFLLELLPGWYEDEFVLFERERIAQLQLHFLEALTYALVGRCRLAEALDVAFRLVGADPLREASQRALLSVYRAERSFGQARRQYGAYRELIFQTFGDEPSAGLAELAGVER